MSYTEIAEQSAVYARTIMEITAERDRLAGSLKVIRDICDDHYDGAPDAPHWMSVLMEIYDVLDRPAPKEE